MAQEALEQSDHLVELMVRTTCGSCERVLAQITPVCEAAGVSLEVRNVDEGTPEAQELAMEYGDRVPVVVIDGEEFSCWEVDNDELAEELASLVS